MLEIAGGILLALGILAGGAFALLNWRLFVMLGAAVFVLVAMAAGLGG